MNPKHKCHHRKKKSYQDILLSNDKFPWEEFHHSHHAKKSKLKKSIPVINSTTDFPENRARSKKSRPQTKTHIPFVIRPQPPSSSKNNNNNNNLMHVSENVVQMNNDLRNSNNNNNNNRNQEKKSSGLTATHLIDGLKHALIHQDCSYFDEMIKSSSSTLYFLASLVLVNSFASKKIHNYSNFWKCCLPYDFFEENIYSLNICGGEESKVNLNPPSTTLHPFTLIKPNHSSSHVFAPSSSSSSSSPFSSSLIPPSQTITSGPFVSTPLAQFRKRGGDTENNDELMKNKDNVREKPYHIFRRSVCHIIDDNKGNTQVWLARFSPGLEQTENMIARAYSGGVLAPNNRLFLCPFGISFQSTWHYIDTKTGKVCSYQRCPGVIVQNAYRGGVLAPDGRIFLVPYEQAPKPEWHYIDTMCDPPQVKSYKSGMPESLDVESDVWAIPGAYWGGSLIPGNKIILTPYNQASKSVWHMIDLSNGTKVLPFLHQNPIQHFAASEAYRGSVLDPIHERVYFIPHNQASQKQWHFLDWKSHQVNSYLHTASGLVSSGAYSGGVYDPVTETIWFVPFHQGSQSTWHYLDLHASSSTSLVKSYSSSKVRLRSGHSCYDGGFLGSNGKIYLVPHNEAPEIEWHAIDPLTHSPFAYRAQGSSSSSSSSSSSPLVAAAFSGAIADTHGSAYLIPYEQSVFSHWHKLLFTGTSTFNDFVALAPYR